MKTKKSQAAMEFMLTYGWAILAAIIAIGVLAYFGVFDPNSFVNFNIYQEECYNNFTIHEHDELCKRVKCPKDNFGGYCEECPNIREIVKEEVCELLLADSIERVEITECNGEGACWGRVEKYTKEELTLEILDKKCEVWNNTTKLEYKCFNKFIVGVIK
jgi:hypothetical protein